MSVPHVHTIYINPTPGKNVVNALTSPVLRGILDGLRSVPAGTRCIVLTSSGRTFSAGVDITGFGAEPEPDATSLDHVLRELEDATLPVVAVVPRGYALGGGLELLLACSHRVLGPDAHVGLPEVRIGLIPGGGGTQRLPRAAGVASA
eukprot:CAMPEP_0194281592 /NCGR_PEP_ID=MMETSP0169-20130528/21061_1 /TAXON_ID=218684 /ORGANISM="Corethron pennatum, Strain L29A3" /LENGTH=147 /DNA_ID=CAMNT_0039026693 /DNA_START=90 /DNA_END=530 /DNA_ORIENTATION=+